MKIYNKLTEIQEVLWWKRLIAFAHELKHSQFKQFRKMKILMNSSRNLLFLISSFMKYYLLSFKLIPAIWSTGWWALWKKKYVFGISILLPFLLMMMKISNQCGLSEKNINLFQKNLFSTTTSVHWYLSSMEAWNVFLIIKEL